ncbi:hypothetical protein M422DRAFT_99431, partial [Sphaerobolus stellatus SS14]
IECECCFDDMIPFDEMIQCPEGHLFCPNCVRQQAETAVGNRMTEIVCMSVSECKQPFTYSTLSRCVDNRTLRLWQKLLQLKSIREAHIDHLEECPFCDFAIIILETLEALPTFMCYGCGARSCRRCRKKAHPGSLCQDELEERNVQEAMTNALKRVCPECHIPFVKQDGCNKIYCTQCHKFSCYLCRELINQTTPYSHF